MGGLSNIIDGLYSNADGSAEDGPNQAQDSTEVSPKDDANDQAPLDAHDPTEQDTSDDASAPEEPEDSTKYSLQDLADKMSAESEDDTDVSDDEQDDVFATPVRGESDLETLVPPPVPPSETERTQFSEMVASAASDSGDDFTAATPPEGHTEPDSVAVDAEKQEPDPEVELNIEDEAVISHETEAEPEVDLMELEGQHPFIWTRASDDIMPSRRRRR